MQERMQLLRYQWRDGGLIVTDPFTESVSNVDLGGTTPDPGTITNLSINGAGKYQGRPNRCNT